MVPSAVLMLALLASASGLASASLYSSPVSNPPMFIIISNDDNTDSRSASKMKRLTSGVKNPNGCKPGVTYFTTIKWSKPSTVKSLYNAGHEIAVHTLTHQSLYGKSDSVVKKEVVGCRDTLVKWGIPKSALKGARSPYLEASPNWWKTLNSNGFKYDSSLMEYYGDKGSSPSLTKRQWPYKLSGGIKTKNCYVFHNLKCSGSYSKLVEIPMEHLQYGPCNGKFDNCDGPMDPYNPYDEYKTEFDRRYSSNRAPLGVFLHMTTTGWGTSSHISATSKFLKYAAKHKDVWMVTHAQLNDWIRKPVSASGMKSFMSKYKCPK